MSASHPASSLAVLLAAIAVAPDHTFDILRDFSGPAHACGLVCERDPSGLRIWRRLVCACEAHDGPFISGAPGDPDVCPVRAIARTTARSDARRRHGIEWARCSPVDALMHVWECVQRGEYVGERDPGVLTLAEAADVVALSLPAATRAIEQLEREGRCMRDGAMLVAFDAHAIHDPARLLP